jgi:hypothetical protein
VETGLTGVRNLVSAISLVVRRKHSRRDTPSRNDGDCIEIFLLIWMSIEKRVPSVRPAKQYNLEEGARNR